MGFDGHQLLYTTAAVLLAVVLYATCRTPVIRRHGVPLRKPPHTLPLAGNGILFLQARHKLFAWFVTCQRQFGRETFQVAVPTLPPGVVINDPRVLDFVFRNEGSRIGKGSFVKGMLRDLFGHGIVNVDGHLWRVQRKAGLAFLNTANLGVLTDIALPKHLEEVLVRLGESADQSADTHDKTVDLQAVFHELTSCIMGKMAYNMEMHADDDFSVAFDYASEKTTERFQNPLWPVTETVSALVNRVLGGGSAAELYRSLAIVKAFGRRIVSTAVADKQTHHGHPKEVSGSLIQSLLESISDQDIVADAALNYLSAGRDTVAQALTWTFYMLIQNPRIVDKIRREVQQVLDKEDDNSHNIVPHLARLTPAAMPYTMATFYEGLRLFPPVPFEIRQVEADLLVLPDGTELPKGSLVIWCSWALNRSRETWGDDADDFRPERWLTDSNASTSTNTSTNAATPARLMSRSPSEFPVFHGGPHACLGKKMAESMAVQAMAAVAWSFDFRLANPDEERVTRTSLTLPMEGGLPCFVQSREFV